MAALDPGNVGDLGLHHPRHPLEPDRGRGREQPLLDLVFREGGEMAVDHPGQLLWQTVRDG
jgi:hypothetical protein